MSNTERATGEVLTAEKSSHEMTDKEFNRFMRSVHAPRGVSIKRMIYFPFMKMCIHPDRPGMCSPDYGYNWREQTEAEKIYADSFYQKFEAWAEKEKPLVAEAK